MSDFQKSIRTLSEQYSPAVIFGARLGKPGEAPQSLREQVDPWSAWSEQAAESIGVAVEIAGSQRLGKDGNEDAVAVLAGVRMAYMKVVSDLADKMNIAEGVLHNRINETLNNAAVDDGPDMPNKPESDDDNPMFNR